MSKQDEDLLIIEDDEELDDDETIAPPLRIYTADATAGIGWIAATVHALFRNGAAWFLIVLALIGMMFATSFLIGMVTGSMRMFRMGLLGMSFGDKAILLLLFFGMWIVSALIHGGIVLAADSQHEEDDLSVSYIFAGFQYKFKELAILGSIQAVVILLTIWLVFSFVGGLNLLLAVFFLSKFKLIGLIILMLLPLTIISWFSGSLIVLRDVPALEAIVLSIKAFAKNIVAFLIYFILMGLLGFIMFNLFEIIGKMLGKNQILYLFFLNFYNIGMMVLHGLIAYFSYRSVFMRH